jgi:sulfate adenylyltransferase subunit 1
MDLVDFSEEVFNNIKAGYEQIAEILKLKKVYYLPISARDGDNVVDRSKKTPWYTGETLLHLLENIPVREDITNQSARFPVQYVIRPQNDRFHDYRAYAGRIASGSYKVGDKVIVLPSYSESTIKAIDEVDKSLEEASAPQSVSIRLTDNIDVSRGNMIVKKGELPQVNANISVLVCWLNHRPLSIGAKYIIRHTTDEVFGIIKDVYFKVDINNLENVIDDKTVNMNDIAHISIKTSKPLKYDLYAQNRTTGSLVIINEATFETVGAGMIVEQLEEQTFVI